MKKPIDVQALTPPYSLHIHITLMPKSVCIISVTLSEKEFKNLFEKDIGQFKANQKTKITNAIGLFRKSIFRKSTQIKF